MERLKELISQLMEQFDRKAEPSLMLQTTQQLEAELRALAAQPAPGRVMPTKIAVMMPSASKITPASVAESAAKTTPSEAPIKTSPSEAPSKAVSAPKATPTINGTLPAINGTPSG